MGIEDTLWSVKLPNGDVRSGTRQQLEEALQAGHIDGNALVLASGAQEWVKLSSLRAAGALPVPAPTLAAPQHAVARPPSAPPPPAAQRAEGDHEVWQIQLTRRQVEVAFRAGHLGESVLVLTSGARDWVTLGSALLWGQSTRAPAAPVSPRPSAPPPQPQALSSMPRTDGDIWQVKLSNGEVRTGTREQLVEALQGGHLDANALVLASGAREWVKLGGLVQRGTLPPPPVTAVAAVAPQRATAAPPPVVAPPAPEPRAANGHWQVRLANGEIRSGTREQLEEAVRGGHLDANSLVLASGASEWGTLRSLMEAAPVPPAPSCVQASVTTTAAWPASDAAAAPAAATPQLESTPKTSGTEQETAPERSAVTERSTETEQARATEPGADAEPGGATDPERATEPGAEAEQALAGQTSGQPTETEPLSGQRIENENGVQEGKHAESEVRPEAAPEESALQNGGLDE